MLTWTAVTTATPWGLTDTESPALTLGGARLQRPLRSRRVTVHVACPKESCAASASMAVAGVRLLTARAPVEAGSGRTLRLAVPAKARRAIRAALRARRGMSARAVVIARDAAGNRTRATRTITLRR